MTHTPSLALPLLEAAQAQKHVTVNEALSLLDALTQLSVRSAATAAPPPAPAEGERYLLPASPTGDWTGEGDKVALFLNGGWAFLAPRAGWRVFVEDAATGFLHDGQSWRRDPIALAPSGARTFAEVREAEHVISAGASNTVSGLILDRMVVIGITARVTEVITGPSSFRIGVAGALDRYGSGIGPAAGSEAHGITGAPVGYYGDTNIELTADGGVFAAGRIRLAVHALRLAPPPVV